jgi:predicted dehydrogenase
VLELESGVPANLLMSWDIWSTHLPYIEVYGSDGSMSLPNPDEYEGLPRVRMAAPEDLRQPPPPPGSLPWATLPPAYGARVERGIGVADMAHAIRTGRPHRAAVELAYHVLEVLTALPVSSSEGRHVDIESRCKRPDRLEPGSGRDPWLPPLAAGPACA